MLLFASLWTLLSHWKTWGLESAWALDLALYHSAVWNLAEGNGFTNTLIPHRGDGLFAQDHFEPILILASLVYRVVPRLEMILFVQASLMALGALGVARLLRQEGVGPWSSVFGSVVYLMWWPIWRLAMMDIRPVMWSVPFVLLAVVALRAGRVRAVLLWGFLACLCREELPLFLLILAVAAWFWGGSGRTSRRRACLSLAALSLLYLFGTWLLRTDPTLHTGGTDWLALLSGGGGAGNGGSAFDQLPGRLAWVGSWAVPLVLGALAALEIVFIAVPAAVFLAVTDIQWTHWNDSRTHYISVLLPGMVAASAVGWPRILATLRGRLGGGRHLAWLLFLGLLMIQTTVLYRGWNEYIAPETSEARSPTAELQAIHDLVDALPDEASVLTSGALVHLVASRRHVFSWEEETPPPTTEAPPLVPRAGVDPGWAILPRNEDFWGARARAAGLVERQETEDYVLLGPPAVSSRRDPPLVGREAQSCPEAMVLVGGGTYRLGETDDSWIERFPEGQIVARDWSIPSFCVARDPFPGEPHPWFPDGLILPDLPALEGTLVATGRRLCRAEELVLAASGPANWRYPYHPKRRSPDTCDPDDPSPDPFGSYTGCLSPVGARDFMVRSSWARVGAEFGLNVDFAVVGGLVREDTMYAPTNFGLHQHLATDPRNFEDDGLRLCADPGESSSAQDEAWNKFMAGAVAAGSFEGLIRALPELAAN